VVRGVWWARSRSFVDRAGDESNTVLLLGSARSGTTWIGEMIDRHHDHRIVFEPFRPGALPRLAPLGCIRYLPPDHRAADLADGVREILTGRFRNGWVDHMSSPGVFRRRLVKEVRVNCLAPWLTTQFPTTKTIVVLRHPMDVARSRAALGWGDELGSLMQDRRLAARLSEEQRTLLTGLHDPFVGSIGQWALETLIPLRELDPARAHVVLYEDLVADPLGVGSQLLEHVGQRPDAALRDAAMQPSRTTRHGPAHNLLVSRPALHQAATLLEAFGLDRLYAIDSAGVRPGGLASFGFAGG